MTDDRKECWMRAAAGYIAYTGWQPGGNSANAADGVLKEFDKRFPPVETKANEHNPLGQRFCIEHSVVRVPVDICGSTIWICKECNREFWDCLNSNASKGRLRTD